MIQEIIEQLLFEFLQDNLSDLPTSEIIHKWADVIIYRFEAEGWQKPQCEDKGLKLG